MRRTKVSNDLRTEFRRDFYRGREAAWIEDVVDESDDVEADVTGYLAALSAGRRNFSYPGHDEAVFETLQRMVPSRRISRGADVGCATGCFPAMQLASGVEECTVFEVRPINTNSKRIKIRIQDLTYAREIEPEFDLITCLSTIEHIGLGRYGDRLDPRGDIKMAANLGRLLRPGGIMLMSFPVGRGCVVYNKHRIYSRQRRAALFGDLTVIDRVPDRSWYGQLRQLAAIGARRPGSFSQPIFVLERPR